MTRPDLNLLVTLDVVLSEGSVARAARRLGLSPSAMSRALSRLRDVTGDPLLVRAGRGLVPTPRALELRDRVGQIVSDAESLLRPAERLDLARLARTFTLRTSEGFVENFGAGLVVIAAEQAPGVRLRFVQKPDKDSTPLRDGAVDLETGVVESSTSPELRTRTLFEDHYVGVVRAGHSLEAGTVTLSRYFAGDHVSVARRGADQVPLDSDLKTLGRERTVVAIVDGFASALALAKNSDLIATVPARHTGKLRAGMHTFVLPLETSSFTVSMLWHPRFHADPAHRWLRGLVAESCAVKR